MPEQGKQFLGSAKQTFLAAPVAPTDTTIELVSAAGWPNPATSTAVEPTDPIPQNVLPFVITLNRGQINEEKVLIASRSGNTLTVAQNGRGYDSTSATSHGEGSTVHHTIDAFTMNRLMEHVNNPAGVKHLISQIEGLRAELDALAATALGDLAGVSLSAPQADQVLAYNSGTGQWRNLTLAGADARVPVGVICLWAGLTANIPSGWALCNGQNGTPDLRDRFVVASGGAYATGDTGGADSVTLTAAQMPAHTHDAAAHTHSTPNHSHSVPAHTHSLPSHRHIVGSHTHSSGTLSTSTAGSHNHSLYNKDVKQEPGSTSSYAARYGPNTGGGSYSSSGVLSAGSHSHSVSGNTGGSSSFYTGWEGGTSGSASAASTPSSGAGTTGSGGGGATTSAGGGSAHENRPRYYALAYIQKIS